MKRFLLLFLLLVPAATMQSQLVIDLNRGGATVRSKTLSDYDRVNKEPAFEREDSLAYRDCLVRGFSALHADSLDEAKRMFETALKVRPDVAGNHIIRHNLGRIEMARGHWQEALKIFNALLKELPGERAIRLDRAKTCLSLHMPAEAVADCDVLLQGEKADSALKELYFLRAAALMERRLYGDARADLRRVLALDPGNEGALLLDVIALERDSRPQEAMQCLNLYVSAHPESVEALALRADMEQRNGMVEAARYDLDRAIGLAPDDASLYLARAALLKKAGLSTAARKDVEKANALAGTQLTLNDINP